MSGGNKRYREASLLASEIRAADNDSNHEIEKRTKYIKMQLDKLDEDQLTRFEFFVRSHLSRSKVENIISNTLGSQRAQLVNSDMAIVVGGLTKLFIGDLIETALDVLKDSDADDGIKPEHIMESYRRLQRDGKVGRLADSSFLFSSVNCSGGVGGTGEDLFSDSIHDLIEGSEEPTPSDEISSADA